MSGKAENHHTTEMTRTQKEEKTRVGQKAQKEEDGTSMTNMTSFMTRKGTISDQEASQMVQQDHTVTLEEVQAEEEKLTEGTTKEEEKITETTGRTTGQIAQTDKEGEAVETKEVISALRAV